MDDKLNAEESGLNITPNEQNEDGVIFNPKVEEEGRIDEFPESEKSYEELQAEVAELDKEENPEEELSEEEMREMYIQALKDSRKVFRPVKHNGNVTTNQFGVAYKQKRKRKNSLAKKSRQANRR
jgi:hypothetical protein